MVILFWLVEITKKIGYNDIKLPPRENKERQEKKEIQKERENISK